MRATIVSLGLLLMASAAHADTYQYTFTINNLSNLDQPFTLTITEPSLISSTGLTSLPSSLPTSLGYTVNYFGENNSGVFLFSNSGGTITNAGVTYSAESFSFTPAPLGTGYDGIGNYAGSIAGNDLIPFTGTATLNVKDLSVSPVPEPSSLALLGTGYLGVLGLVRSRFRRL